jgi:hypothetical protein
MHLWKRLLTVGPDKYGDVYYLGEAPLYGRDGLFDVLVASHDVIEAHFYFEPTTGRLAGLEMISSEDADPCEVYFDAYQVVDGRAVPQHITVIFADRVFADLQITEVDLMLTDEERADDVNPDAGAGDDNLQ